MLGPDVDGSGAGDLVVVSGESLSIFIAGSRRGAADADQDGVLDECESGASFRRGDFNADGRLDLSDAIAILLHLFAGGRPGTCFKAGDADDGGSVNLTDPIVLLLHLFAGRGPLPEPTAQCGLDPTPDGLGCERFGPCE